eukprot:286291-Pleurochrysis_carterae.AAC.2
MIGTTGSASKSDATTAAGARRRLNSLCATGPRRRRHRDPCVPDSCHRRLANSTRRRLSRRPGL